MGTPCKTLTDDVGGGKIRARGVVEKAGWLGGLRGIFDGLQGAC